VEDNKMKSLRKLASKSGVAACTAALFIGVMALADGPTSGVSSCGPGKDSCDCPVGIGGGVAHTCCPEGKCKLTTWSIKGPFGIDISRCTATCK